MADAEKIEIFRTPRYRRHGQLLDFLVGEFPQRQQRALAISIFVSSIFIVLEIYATEKGIQQKSEGSSQMASILGKQKKTYDDVGS